MAIAARTFTELLVDLYRRLNNRVPEPEVIEGIRQLQEENGLLDGDRIPGWLYASIAAALARHESPDVLFPEVGSDVGSFLIEVSELIPGWEHVDDGEWITISFTVLGVQIYISREAMTIERTSCCSYSVRLLSAPK